MRHANEVPIELSGRTHREIVPSDDALFAVQATVIDLGLARIDDGSGSDSDGVRWTLFDDETFDGEGDYQYDVYRMMREHNGNEWKHYKPLSNVMVRRDSHHTGQH